MDSVEGQKGGKVLLPLHFVKAELMVAFLRDSNDSQSVIDCFDQLYLELGPDVFMSLIPLILTDNGSEFSNPGAIESDRQGNPRTRIFYCDPSSPGQKGSAEKNHEFIRYVLPKGTSFDALEQADISLLMDHINSYSRESLGNKCPYEMFEFLYGSRTLQALGVHRIPANEVNLTPSLLVKQRLRATLSQPPLNHSPGTPLSNLALVKGWHLLWQKTGKSHSRYCALIFKALCIGLSIFYS